MENNLMNRTLKFATDIYRESNRIQKKTKEFSITNQIIRSSTSIGANYFEAQNAISKNDFIFKIGISHKEILETIFWLKFMKEVELYEETTFKKHINEAEQLNKIFASILIQSKKNKQKVKNKPS